MYSPAVTLKVRLRILGARDRLGNAIWSYSEPVDVSGCLFAPGVPADIGVGRPEGVKVSATAYFPKSYSADLRRALISLDGKVWMRVVGDPMSFPASAIPGRWTTYAILERYDG